MSSLESYFGSPELQQSLGEYYQQLGPAPAGQVPEGNPLQPMPYVPPEPTTGPQLNPLQTMEFRDTNGNKIEDREEGIYLSRDYMPKEESKGMGLAEAFAPQTMGLEEAFAPQTMGLEEAFSDEPSPLTPSAQPERPLKIQFGEKTVNIPPAFYEKSEEQQARIMAQIKKNAESYQEIESGMTSKEEFVGSIKAGIPTYGDVTKQKIDDATNIKEIGLAYPGMWAGMKMAPNFANPWAMGASKIGGALMGSHITAPYMDKYVRPHVDKVEAKLESWDDAHTHDNSFTGQAKNLARDFLTGNWDDW